MINRPAVYFFSNKSWGCAVQPVCSETHQGIVKVGAVDADQHKSLGGQYGVKGFPTIKIFGANKNKPEEYQGTDKQWLLLQNAQLCDFV